MRPEQMERYSRHIILKEIGGVGQARLLNSTVFLLGLGGLGSPVALYLAAAGVGHMVLADDDRVELSNLQRQVIHTTDRLGWLKVDSAAEAIHALNPDVRITTIPQRITEKNVRSLIQESDLVVEGVDNFETRYLINDACHQARKPLVSGALFRFEGQVSTFRSGVMTKAPCYRCLYPSPPEPGAMPSCAEAGIVGALAGLIGTMIATETIKELLGIGESLSGTLILFHALDSEYRRIRFSKNPDCPTCL